MEEVTKMCLRLLFVFLYSYKVIQEAACELIPGAFISSTQGKRKLCRHEDR